MNGQTALITGASSGIGAAIAAELAARGTQLILVARSENALNQLADTLAARHGQRPVVIAADLAETGCGARLLQAVQARGLTVDILVNNAGFGTYGAFEALEPEIEQAQIAVNIAAVVDLCHAFIPGMLARGRGRVLNIASTAAFQPGPYLAVYAATKAFVLSFSEALWAEYRGRGVHVAALCPGAVDTGFIDKLGDPGVRKTAVFSRTLDVATVARGAIAALAGSAPSRVVGLRNWALAQAPRVSPRAMVAKMGAGMMRPR
ncbi:MAG: SDR family oxidoreductase [Betaproteobacteria bacterium]|nr:SDR family oxidoreductase [Betaproteobacteria bacterium]